MEGKEYGTATGEVVCSVETAGLEGKRGKRTR